MSHVKKYLYLFASVLFLSSVMTPSAWSKSVSLSNQCEAVAAGDMIDKNYIETVTDWKDWGYSQTMPKADLNADGKAESVLIKARVSKDSGTNELIWDDGQPWAVIIRETTGKETMVFLGWVQLSEVQAQILPSKKGKEKILRVNVPQADDYADDGKVYKVSIKYDISYSRPDKFSVCETIIKRVKK